MDGVLKLYYQVEEQRFVPNKQNRMKIQKKNTRSKSISNPCDTDNVVATYAGLMNPPSFFYQQQPPLLPLPTVSPSTVKSRKNRSREISNNNKSKQTTREEVKNKATGLLTTPVVCTSSFRSTAIAGNGNVDFASWVFNLSPPPSSLPVPKFCMRRSKFSSNAETN